MKYTALSLTRMLRHDGARSSGPKKCTSHPHPPTQAPCTPALAHTSSLDTDLTRNTRAPHFTPQHWLLCHMGLYQFELLPEHQLQFRGALERPQSYLDGGSRDAAAVQSFSVHFSPMHNFTALYGSCEHCSLQ